MNDDSVEILREKAKSYFNVCIPLLKFDNIDILSTITGLNMISLNRDIEIEIEDFMVKVHKNYQYTSGSLIFWKNNVIYNDMDFDYLKDMTVLYDYLIDPNISKMPFIKINSLQDNKPIIKSTHMSTSSTQSQIVPQNKNTTYLIKSIKNFNIFSNRDANQNTGFLTGPLSVNNSSVGSNINKLESIASNTSKESSTRSLFGKVSSLNSSSSDIRKLGGGKEMLPPPIEIDKASEKGNPLLENSSSHNNSNNSISSSHNNNNNNNKDKDNFLIKEDQFLLNNNIVNEPLMECNTIELPQIIYLGDNCEPYYLIIYKYLEEITALFFIKVSNTQEFDETYISLSKLSKSKDTITSFDSINSKEDAIEVILKSEEFYYSFEATIRSDLDQILNHMIPLIESQNNTIDEQYKYIIFKHSKMLIKASKGYLKSPNFNKTIAQYILDLYDDIEKKQDCTELCLRSNNSLWIGIKRIDQCDYIIILPRNGFKELTEIDDEFNK
eukprot:jgi/Orpsp1_1/1176701/evm.model.c7180000058650.1